MKSHIVAGILIAALLSACGQHAPMTEPRSTNTGDVSRGESIFIAGNGTGAPPCTTCHSVGGSAMSLQLGPNLTHIATDAAVRIDGMQAHDYIRESILSPNNHIISGYRVGMYPNYADDLSEDDLADLIAFLMTLE